MNKDHSRIRTLIQREIEAIQSIPVDGAVYHAVDLVFQQVHQLGGKVVVSGMGKAGQIGINIATTLSSTGTPAVFIHPAEAQHGDLGVLQKNDVLLAISNSGKTREVVELEQLARRLYPHMKMILLTGNNQSDLAAKADVVLYTGGPAELCPLGLTPTTSTTVMTVAGDLLVVLLMEKIGFTKADYALRHHSGYLGQKAKEE
jgi:arabinose-5-phosphate isomerase